MSATLPASAVRAPSALLLALAGSAAVGTAFGMARYGYGLLLPDIQDDLVLGATALGAIGTLGYVAYVLASVLVGRSVARLGGRGTVVLGGALAVAGMAVVAVASGPVLLAVGVAVAGASCGLVYPPFADAVDALPAAARGRVLAAVNCGTGWGVAIAAPIAVGTGDAWRAAYVGFALCAVASTAFAARVLPPRDPDRRARGPVERVSRVQAPARERTLLVAGAVLVGLGSAAYWTFATEQLRTAGLDAATGRLVLGAAGVASLLGVVAADVVRRAGARRTFVACAAAEAAALAATALAPGTALVAFAAAVAFGAAYNTLVAVQVLHAVRLRPDASSSGVALAAGANAAGLLWGPLAGGALADAIGLTATLLAGAAVVAASASLAPPAGGR